MAILLLLDPEIWGTVSDWVMVIVTTFSIYLLYTTLKSQRDVQKMQNELFRIENVRFRESIKPILKFSLSGHFGQSSNQNEKLITIEVTNEANSLATNISRIVAENNELIKQVFTADLDNKRNHLTKGDKPLLFHFVVDKRHTQYIIMIFKYQDVAGTSYQQRVLCIYDEDYPVEFYPSLPETNTNDIDKQDDKTFK